MMQGKFTPLHLVILISVYSGNDEGYTVTDTSNEFERDLQEQGLLWRNDIGYMQITKYGEAKLNELLLRMDTPRNQMKMSGELL